FFQKASEDAAFFDQKAAPKNFSCFLSMMCFQTASQLHFIRTHGHTINMTGHCRDLRAAPRGVFMPDPADRQKRFTTNRWRRNGKPFPGDCWNRLRHQLSGLPRLTG
ncbi:hypothetical protein, partial [Novacetimonas hansenii]|uniref:hypothetical protein n=1 Tax=Novacetimonas hansenii TaxID=436 RepID=UPI00222E67C5